jgi:DNA-directed RNA polymerase specialized sigma24 family protein
VLGYSAEDVGKLLGKQAGAVRALQFRALGALARLLQSADDAQNTLNDRPRHSRGQGKGE